MLTRKELRQIYDRVGTWQDAQSFYEGPAVDRLLDHGDFGRARSVVEIGCGTGALARQLLADRCPETTTYEAVELSPIMADLARRRLKPWKDRVRIRSTAGAPPLERRDASADRIVIAYVLDLMSESEIRWLLREARRVLRPGGLLCTCGLAPGQSRLARIVEVLWRIVFAIRPSLVGGCRPLNVRPLLGSGWTVQHHDHVCAYGITSEVLVASPRRSSESSSL
jgi:ubiquinone/menaquinone biosynthesis C-methylase UbiE